MGQVGIRLRLSESALIRIQSSFKGVYQVFSSVSFEGASQALITDCELALGASDTSLFQDPSCWVDIHWHMYVTFLVHSFVFAAILAVFIPTFAQVLLSSPRCHDRLNV